MFANGSDGLQPRNRLLASLPTPEVVPLLAKLEPVVLHPGEVLCHFGEEIPFIYFPEDGFISLEATMLNGATVETGIVGNEGMIGVPVFLGADSAPYRTVVQVSGKAWRMSADVFRDEVRRSVALRRLLLLYTQALMTQMSQLAACNCLHRVEERLSRLLLMIHDRVKSGEFFLTHEVIAEMLGTRRAGVTVAAGKLRQAGVISYLRGQVHILDRKHLELFACECYRTEREEFDRLLELSIEPQSPVVQGAIKTNGANFSAGINRQLIGASR